ncbi:MAG TPA: non-canonical purine NTP pyrophosphatase, RdgB/HAM1 family [Candidatus Pacebacteria bacterium]|nr:non-canonical purine NTP pyrophosphatase, RdgB/HAM1 family [Candidatus Paceibacterota bacterium]
MTATQRLLLASRNPHKLVEVRAVLEPLGWQVLSVADQPKLAQLPDPTETGATFSENAQLKAEFYRPFWPDAILADDSGLEVAALNGFPGVASNRWFLGTAAQRNQALLTKLATLEATESVNRAAQFVTVLAWMAPQKTQVKFFKGIVSGRLLDEPHGQAGFGYDPLFVPAGYDQSFAELGLKEKNKLSHRAQALRALIEFLTHDQSETV